MKKRNDLFQELKDSTLERIFKFCFKNYYNENIIKSDIQIFHNGYCLGMASFEVSADVLEEGSEATNEYPPTPDIVEFRLNNIEVRFIFSTRGTEATNVKNALNKLLKEFENEILKL